MATYFGGRLSDSIGCRTMIFSGWAFYACVYLAFGTVQSVMMLVGIFLAYGIYFGLTEPAERAWIAKLVPAHLRGTAFGYYNSAVGIGALPASILFGALWNGFGVQIAFAAGAGFALVASALLLRVRIDSGNAG